MVTCEIVVFESMTVVGCLFDVDGDSGWWECEGIDLEA